MPAEVVQLRDSPLVSDVPGQLRSMATAIENGLECETALFVIHTGGEPEIFIWGEHKGDLAHIGILELAKAGVVREKLIALD